MKHISSFGWKSSYLNNLTISELFHLANITRSHISPTSILECTLSALKKRTKFDYGINLFPNFTIKVPYHPSFNKTSIHRVANILFNLLPLAEDMKAYLKAHTRIVYTKNQTVHDILCNFKTFTKNFSDEPPICVCKTKDKHKYLTPDKLPKEDREIFTQNGRNIPIPSHTELKSYLIDSFFQIKNYIGKLSITENLPPKFDYIKTPFLFKNPNKDFASIFNSDGILKGNLKLHRIIVLYNNHIPNSPSLDIFALSIKILLDTYPNTGYHTQFTHFLAGIWDHS